MSVLTDLAVARDRTELRAARRALHGRVGLVMTMGALHEGHAALIRAARQECDSVAVTIFVNPLQFSPGEDLARYPRTVDADIDVCHQEGVDVVFAPTPDVVYPGGGGPQVTVDPGPLGEVLEGSRRPGHFHGVLTVVAKLLQLVPADAAYFGEKDYQQLVLVRRMVRDLDLAADREVRIACVPTVREPDGLALSSRNRYLDPADREAAPAMHAALLGGTAVARRGAEAVLSVAQAAILRESRMRLDYLQLVAPDLGPVGSDGGPARLLVAAGLGDTRLIDNEPCELGAS